MRLGLIGCDYHWTMYQALLRGMPQVRVAAVAPGCPGEQLAAFDDAPGVTSETLRFEDPRRLLDEAKLDLVQISTAFECMGPLAIEAAQRGLPIVAEKPIAADLETLARLERTLARNETPVLAMQGMLGHPAWTAAREAVRGGRIGTPYAGYHQKSYRWGSRPETWKKRETFPGLIPWVGIHALAWMVWILGDVFVEVGGWEGHGAHPDYPACASNAGLVYRMDNGGTALLSIDYLRPDAAPTHGDERMRIAGSEGVIEAGSQDRAATLITRADGPTPLEPKASLVDPYCRFAAHLQGDGAPPVSTREVLRVTRIALLSQQAAETGKRVAL